MLPTCNFFYLFSVMHHFFSQSGFSKRITWEIKTINWNFSINFIKNKFLINLLQIYHFLIAFYFLEHFQLKHVSLFILDQYLIVFFIFQFQKVHCLQIIKGVCFFLLKKPVIFLSFLVLIKIKNPFLFQLIPYYAIFSSFWLWK